MPACAVTGCKKRFGTSINDESYVRSESEGSEDEESSVKRLEPRTFHKFPGNAELRKIWLKNIGREDLNGRKNVCICSDHFKESDINRRANKNIRHNVMLKPGAVPTRFKTAKRKQVTYPRSIMLKENPTPLDDFESQDSPPAGSDQTHFVTVSDSPIKRTKKLRAETEEIDQCIVNDMIEIESINIKVEADPYFISEDEEIGEEVPEMNPNYNTMKNEIIMLKTKLSEAVQKINSYEKLMLEKKRDEAENFINLNEKKMDSIINSYKKKIDLKNKKISQLQQNNHRFVKLKERLKSKSQEIKMLQQSNRRLVKMKDRLKNIIRELKKKNIVRKKSDLKKNNLDLFCGTNGSEACSEGTQHHTFEIVESWKNNKLEIIWRKKETVSTEDGIGSAEEEIMSSICDQTDFEDTTVFKDSNIESFFNMYDNGAASEQDHVFDRRKNDGIISIKTDPTSTKIPKDVFRNLQDENVLTKIEKSIKEKCNINIDAIHTEPLPNLKIGISTIESSCLNDELKICEKSNTEEQPNQIKNNWIFKCNQCNKSLPCKSELRRHQQIHTKPFICSHCGRRFARNTSLVQHQRIHTGEKPFKCSYCSKSFPHYNNCRRHEKMHTGEKPYKCDICDKTFTRKVTLEEHKLIHTGENKHLCSHCGKSFSQKSSLVSHQRIHTGEKPYLCSYCGKSFNRAQILENHKRTHTGERPFICSQCGKGFTQWTSLANHQKIHSGENKIKMVYKLDA